MNLLNSLQSFNGYFYLIKIYAVTCYLISIVITYFVRYVKSICTYIQIKYLLTGGPKIDNIISL